MHGSLRHPDQGGPSLGLLSGGQVAAACQDSSKRLSARMPREEVAPLGFSRVLDPPTSSVAHLQCRISEPSLSCAAPSARLAGTQALPVRLAWLVAAPVLHGWQQSEREPGLRGQGRHQAHSKEASWSMLRWTLLVGRAPSSNSGSSKLMEQPCHGSQGGDAWGQALI